jgi:hypothetical protein
VAEVVQAPSLPVPLAARVHEGEPAGSTRIEETTLEGVDELLRHPVAAVAGGGDGVPVANQGHRIFDGEHLAQRHPAFLLERASRSLGSPEKFYWFRRRLAKPRRPWGMKMTMAVKMMPTGMR